MIVVMKKEASKSRRRPHGQRVEGLGLKAARDRRRRADRHRRRRRRTQDAQRVARKRAGRGRSPADPGAVQGGQLGAEARADASSARGASTVGGGTIGVIAGPCSVESEEQILATARAVKAAGATALRGGAFKPRTSPYSFQGLEGGGPEAAGRRPRGNRPGDRHRSRWPPKTSQLVADYADVLQVGARNMQNYRLLEAVGESPNAGAAQARPQRHDRRAAAGGRVHPQRRQPQRDALRAGHPHVRDATPASRCRWRRSPTCTTRRTCRSSSIPATAPGTRTWCPQMAARQRGRRRRRADPRSPSRPREAP